MRQAAVVSVIAGIVSLAVGILSRLSMNPVSGIEAQAFLQFSQTCLLLTIALVLLEKK